MTGWILVTAAAGTVGRALVPLLVEAGAPVRAGLRDLRSDPFEDVPGVEPVRLDFDDRPSLDEAFAGVRAVYLVTPQAPESVRYVRAAVDAASRARVRHVVRQSVYNVETGTDGIARWHREAEGVIRISGLRHTFLRPNSFMQNFLTINRKAILEDGAFSLPLGRAALSNIDVRDLAAAAAAALTTEEADRESFVLTGPEALTGWQFAEVLSGVIGRPIRYRNESEDARRTPGTDAERAESQALREMAREMRAGGLARVTRGVQELTGRKPIPFERFVRDHQRAFVADSSAAARVA